MKVSVLGYSNAAARIAGHLRVIGAEVTFVVCCNDLPLLEPLCSCGIRAVSVAHINPECLPLDGLTPDAVIVATDNEQFNIHTTMALSALLPETRVVTRLFNLAIGREIELQLPNVKVLSVSEHAAPHFAAAALCADVVSARRQGDFLEATLQEGDETITRRLHVDELPWQGEYNAKACIWPKYLGIPGLFKDRLSLLVATGLILVVLLATAYFHSKLALSWQDALYFVITTLTTTGYGDFSLKDASFAAKLAGMLVMLSGASLFAILFALVTDWIFRARLDFMMGRRKVGLDGHLIVCGVGDVGVRVVENLILTGAKVVVIERDPDHRFNQRIRDLGVSLILADATLEETLILSGVKQARAIICATDSDMHNLEIGLNARALQPAIRTVLRIYDRSFAERIQKNFSFDSALSSSAIAAPVFVDAAVSRLAEGGCRV